MNAAENGLSLNTEEKFYLAEILDDDSLLKKISGYLIKLKSGQSMTASEVNNLSLITNAIEADNGNFPIIFDTFGKDFDPNLDEQDFDDYLAAIAVDEAIDQNLFSLYVKIKLLQKLIGVNEKKQVKIAPEGRDYVSSLSGQMRGVVNGIVPLDDNNRVIAHSRKSVTRKEIGISESMKEVESFKVLNGKAIENLVEEIIQSNSPSLCAQFLHKMISVIYEDESGNISTAQSFYDKQIKQVINHFIKYITKSDLRNCALVFNAISHIYSPQEWNSEWEEILNRAINFKPQNYEQKDLGLIIPTIRYLEDVLPNSKRVNKFLKKHEDIFEKKSIEENLKNHSHIAERFKDMMNDYKKYYKFEIKEEIYIKGLFMDFEIKDPDTGNVLYVFQLDGSVHFKNDEKTGQRVQTESTLRNTKRLQRLDLPYIRFNGDDFRDL